MLQCNLPEYSFLSISSLKNIDYTPNIFYPEVAGVSGSSRGSYTAATQKFEANWLIGRPDDKRVKS